MKDNREPYLRRTEVIDWDQPQVLALARRLAAGADETAEIARRCFEWVRDEIMHSADYRLPRVTCAASQVLTIGSGLCYAKSHLLAALLRANGIPAGFCYQRLSRDDNGPPYCLHGFNAVWLPATGWYRIDPRGNRAGIDARFTPPIERLAFHPRLAGETDLPGILAEPLPQVVAALRSVAHTDELWDRLPDVDPTRYTAPPVA